VIIEGRKTKLSDYIRNKVYCNGRHENSTFYSTVLTQAE